MKYTGYRCAGIPITVFEHPEHGVMFRLDEDSAQDYSGNLNRLGMALAVAEARYDNMEETDDES